MTSRSWVLAGAVLTLSAAALLSTLPRALAQGPSKPAAAAPAAAAKPAANTLGLEVRHIHIRVMDVARTKAFYHDKLGFPVTNETPTVVEFPGLWFGKWTGQGAIPTGGITIGLGTKSVGATYAALKKAGVDVPKPPEAAHGEFSFMVKDPDGYNIEVEGPK